MLMGCGSGMEMKRVAAWIVVVAAVALTSGGVCSAEESPADCLNRCISKCVDARGGLCSFNCALACHWPFAQPTGEVMVNPQGAAELPENAAATQAAFALHKQPGDKPTPPPITPQSPN